MPVSLLAAAAIIALCSILTAAVTLWLLSRSARGARPPAGADHSGAGAVSWLFNGAELVDATASARSALPSQPDEDMAEDDWAGFRAAFAPRFPALDGAEGADAVLPAADAADGAELHLTRHGDTLRVELRDPAANAADRHRLLDMSGALARLTAAMAGLPCPVWQTDETGERVIWANQAYRALSKDDVPLFQMPANSANAARLPLDGPDSGNPAKGKRWFDLRRIASGSDRLWYALDVTAIVEAEMAQRNFVQTLAKTFAQLSTGLAIFDRNRQLALFNPALIDLTALPAEFLSARPNLFSFFDQLRDRRMMPEPKDYTSWRAQLSKLVSAASNGQYSETWTLPSGLTYRISGRPHPDGAVAFLFEDISAEISLTRQFRADMEQGHAILDSLDEAIAIFSQNGVLTGSNAAYRALWNCDGATGIAEHTLLDATRGWQAACAPTPFWGDLRDFAASYSEREGWGTAVTHRDLGRLHCRFAPLPHGATLVTFRTEDAPAAGPALPAPALAGIGA